MKTDALKIRNLTCCNCGSATRGRQWHNRDTGYGICRKCVDWLKESNESREEMHMNYGVERVNYNV